MNRRKSIIKIRKRRGAVSLGVIILFGSIIVEIGFTVGVLAYLLNASNLTVRQSGEALAAAQAGISEGILRIVRDDCGSNPCNFASSTVSISTAPDGLTKTITSTTNSNIAAGKQRRLQAVVGVDPATKAVRVESITEIAL